MDRLDPAGSQERIYEDKGWGLISRPGVDVNDETPEDFVGEVKYVPLDLLVGIGVDGGGGGGGGDDGAIPVSSLGFSLAPMPRADLEAACEGLSPLSRSVLLEGATEKPFTGTTADGAVVFYPYGESPRPPRNGVYLCAGSLLPLFSSDSLFDSKSGWPVRRGGMGRG